MNCLLFSFTLRAVTSLNQGSPSWNQASSFLCWEERQRVRKAWKGRPRMGAWELMWVSVGALLAPADSHHYRQTFKGCLKRSVQHETFHLRVMSLIPTFSVVYFEKKKLNKNLKEENFKSVAKHAGVSESWARPKTSFFRVRAVPALILSSAWLTEEGSRRHFCATELCLSDVID